MHRKEVQSSSPISEFAQLRAGIPRLLGLTSVPTEKRYDHALREVTLQVNGTHNTIKGKVSYFRQSGESQAEIFIINPGSQSIGMKDDQYVQRR